MALKDTVRIMKHLLDTIQKDMAKAETGNKAASQRVRTLSIKLEKTAKLYRKESIKAEKSGSLRKSTKTKKTIKPVVKHKKTACHAANKTSCRTAAKKPAVKTVPAKKIVKKTAAKRPVAKPIKTGKAKKR